MIIDFPLDHPALVPGALALVALVSVAVGYVALRLDRPAPAVVAALPVLALTMAPSGHGASTRGCTVQFAWPGLGGVELRANVALLLPVAVFAAPATRRPGVVLVIGVGTSAAIEAVQALVPAIGRACGTDDWSMDSPGVLAGALAARGLLALAAAATAAL